MDFFLDTGIFLGCDPRDDYHREVNKFFKKYTIKHNTFYSAKKVKAELRKIRRKITRRGIWSTPEIRRVWQIIEQTYEIIKEFVSYEEEGHHFFEPIYSGVYPIVGNDDYDATILTNGIIWGCERTLNTPTLVTIDSRHFCDSKKEICKVVKSCTNYRHVPLEMCAVWDICE